MVTELKERLERQLNWLKSEIDKDEDESAMLERLAKDLIESIKETRKVYE